ncbi:hypothetical protein ACMD2_20501 [Ananas comosus]|uniref:Uncharacterized protein n=1 Tax=Ananas comosus TaxID=4615 RepID=A0A199W498_ANACO|nr:hypothetical protein ACMD2_20501 [Ananas comosus]
MDHGDLAPVASDRSADPKISHRGRQLSRSVVRTRIPVIALPPSPMPADPKIPRENSLSRGKKKGVHSGDRVHHTSPDSRMASSLCSSSDIFLENIIKSQRFLRRRQMKKNSNNELKEPTVTPAKGQKKS